MQQNNGITKSRHLCEIPCSAKFKQRFSTYKEKDINVSTANKKNDPNPTRKHMNICWLFLWCIHRNNKNYPETNHPLTRKFDKFNGFFQTHYELRRNTLMTSLHLDWIFQRKRRWSLYRRRRKISNKKENYPSIISGCFESDKEEEDSFIGQ